MTSKLDGVTWWLTWISIRFNKFDGEFIYTNSFLYIKSSLDDIEIKGSWIILVMGMSYTFCIINIYNCFYGLKKSRGLFCWCELEIVQVYKVYWQGANKIKKSHVVEKDMMQQHICILLTINNKKTFSPDCLTQWINVK